MKKRISKQCLVLMVIVVFSFIVSFPVSGGVEPSPFYEIILRLNKIENNLISINRRLKSELIEVVNTDEYILSELDIIADEVCASKEELDNVIYELPKDKIIPRVKYKLIDIELVARKIVNRVDTFFINRANRLIAPARVQGNSQIIAYITRSYTSPFGIRCSAPPSLDIRVQTLSSSFVVGDKSIEVDEDGFICDPEQWNEEIAFALAETEDINELTEEHWKVMNYLRDYYQKFGVAPMIRKLCKETGFPLKKIYDLFPSGPAKGACKLAGLPKPTGCV